MNFIFRILFLIIICDKCNAICETVNQHAIVCNTLEELNQTSVINNITMITINRNNMDTPMEKFTPFMFENISNVRYLTFNNSINDIDDGFHSFSSLEMLHFQNCQLEQVKSNWFLNASISALIISDSKVKNLMPKCFESMAKLRHVKIEKNNIRVVPFGVFSYTNIQTLFLNYNNIHVIGSEAFIGMYQLRKLCLEGNRLTLFEAHLYFGKTSPKLSILLLAQNQLKRVYENNFMMFPNLRVLMLQQNRLNDLEDRCFAGLERLSYLDISNNKINMLSEYIFPQRELPYLYHFFVHNNQLTFLHPRILLRFTDKMNITLGGNPWQCNCYLQMRQLLYKLGINIICDDQYFDGTRPVCIFGDVNACIPMLRNGESMYEDFSSSLSTYAELKPLCNVLCDRNKPCYDDIYTIINYTE